MIPFCVRFVLFSFQPNVHTCTDHSLSIALEKIIFKKRVSEFHLMTSTRVQPSERPTKSTMILENRPALVLLEIKLHLANTETEKDIIRARGMYKILQATILQTKLTADGT